MTQAKVVERLFEKRLCFSVALWQLRQLWQLGELGQLGQLGPDGQLGPLRRRQMSAKMPLSKVAKT